MQVRIYSPEIYPVCETSFLFNTKLYKKIRIAHNPIYLLTDQIQIKLDKPYIESLLQILNQDKKYINVEFAEDIVRDSSKYFNTQLVIDTDDLSTNLYSYLSNKQQNFDPKILNSLLINTLSKTIIKFFNLIENNKELQFYSNLLDKYISVAKRSENQKEALKGILKSKSRNIITNLNVLSNPKINKPEILHQQPQQNLKIKINSIPSEKVKENKKIFEKNEKNSKEKKRSISPKKKQSESAEEYQEQQPVPKSKNNKENQFKKIQKITQQISLGIYGDTDSGWRERNRPARNTIRIPLINQVATIQQNQNISITSNQKKNVNISQDQNLKQIPNVTVPINKITTTLLQKSQLQIKPLENKVIIQSLTINLPVLFEFPKSKSFNFQKAKLPILLHIQPQDIQIHMNQDQIQILKNGHGYKRKTEYYFVENGFSAEGVSLILGGQCNIEDGGLIIGDIKKCTIKFNHYFNMKKVTIFQK